MAVFAVLLYFVVERNNPIHDILEKKEALCLSCNLKT